MWDDVVEEAPAAVEEAPPAEAASAEATADPAAAGDAAKTEEAEPPAPEEIVKGTDRGRLVCKHWVRPMFSQYNYNYEYRKNYYDDVIQYLDRRNRGLPVEVPRAQTWGERALRTYLSKPSTTRIHNKDTRLLYHISVGAKFQRFHTKTLISRKYAKLGFNTIVI